MDVEININREPYELPLSPGGFGEDDGSEQTEEHSPTLAPIADIPAGPPSTKKARGKGKPATYVWKDELVSELINEWRQEKIRTTAPRICKRLPSDGLPPRW